MSNVSVLMSQFTEDKLVGVTPAKFKAKIQNMIGQVDHTIEGYSEEELAKQRDLSIKYTWGHNHNFGTWQQPGRMGNRHVNLMDNFTRIFPINLEDFKGKKVLDIGCWTGGTTLILKALGAEVVACEEVRKYAQTTEYLLQSFGHHDKVIQESLYELDFNEEFDIIYFPGVIYHLTDPVLALRILYNACKVGGTILIESAGSKNDAPICTFQGGGAPGKQNENLNRGGWNWFLPSTGCLKQMMWSAGFSNIQTDWVAPRVYGYGVKTSRVGITRAGLSRRDIP
jgi:2-polyprenyl-3-methyl-5-hydroxy-6-metoxy-1,4-benzoquinol methylase